MTSPVIDFHTLKVKKRVVIGVAMLFACGLGVPLALVPERGPGDLAMTLVTALGAGVLVLVWCHYDSRQHNRPLGPGFRWLVILLGPLALLLYLVRTRGVKSGWRAIGSAMLLLVGLVFMEAFVYAVVAGLLE